MADNVVISAGTGTTVAADEVVDGTLGTVKVQYVKLMDGTLDATGKVAADAANGLDVDVTRVASQGFTASATFTPAASSHTAGDCVGAAQTFTFLPAPVSGSVIMITDAEFEIDSATAQVSTWRLELYNVTPPSATADDGAWDLPSGDRASYLGFISLGTAVDRGSTQWVEVHGINKLMKLAGATAFGYLVNETTLTTAAVAHIGKLYGTPV